MKLCKLKLKNLNSFRVAVELDFEKPPLDDASLVAITGPTGSGKTTLLDAICVALYNKTPRLSGTGTQNPNHLISHGENEAFAEVHFMANGTRYIAEWSAKRKAPRSGKLLYADTGELITDRLSTQGKSLGANKNTVSEEITAILGLDFEAFKRSIMLAQGEFAAFLKAKDEDRRTILEAAASVSIYDELKKALNDKVNTVEAEYQKVSQKQEGIPEITPEQLADVEVELGRLRTSVDSLNAKNRQKQTEKERETKRAEEFEKLQSLKEREEELSEQQPEIEDCEAELKRAEQASGLRPEKLAFDTASTDLKKAGNALLQAETEHSDAQKQFAAHQTDFEEKEQVYQHASTERDRKIKSYNEARLVVQQAENRFEQAEIQIAKQEELDADIDALSTKLDEKQTKQATFEQQIAEAQRFLDENPLPLDRQARLTRVNLLSAELNRYKEQFEGTSANKETQAKKVASLARKIKKLSKTREKLLAEKETATAELKEAATELHTLQTAGTQAEWDTRKQQAVKAQPSTQKYETAKDDLLKTKERLHELESTQAELNTELAELGDELEEQAAVCQDAAEAVQRCEESLQSAKWANPINEFRQHLHTGEPCLVCGATEHPYAGTVEPEGEALLRNAENALAEAEADAETAETEKRRLETRQVQTEQNSQNTTHQIAECTTEIAELTGDTERCLTQWREFYPDAAISSEWIGEQIAAADTAIANLGKAEQARLKASNTSDTVSLQLETCEKDITRETQDLEDSTEQLDVINNSLEDLKADVAATETRFWESMPDAFHGIAPAEAVEQFTNKINAVAEREAELRKTETDLKLLSSDIQADEGNLEGLQKQHAELQAEIERYQSEGEAFLDTVRQKTDGLATEDEIDTAIGKLDADLQTKENTRAKAEQQLKESRDVSIQKQTAHAMCKMQHSEAHQKFEATRATYFNKLAEAGFDSPTAHDSAFRDETERQELTDKIDDYEKEKQQLAVEITELRTRFDETPFDSEKLPRINAELEEIARQIQETLQNIGAQGQEIEKMKEALKKREELAGEVNAAKQELERWKNLQDTIPKNDLRDFALDIMFQQVARIANGQLAYLTSDRYQLKVETIGKLRIIDRWNANEERPVETLSGGESFLTSLALALALSELSQGRAQLNSLFLDEGFGTLDAETLDIAIAALEGLRMQGRSIYLISHIQELTKRLPVKINVRKRGDGSSNISF